MRKYADTIVCWTFGLLIAGLLWYIRGALWLMEAVVALLDTITGETEDD